MPRGSKKSYSPKQKRQAAKIERSYRQRGTRSRTAKARAWATVNQQDGGARQKPTKRRKKSSTSSRRTTRRRGTSRR